MTGFSLELPFSRLFIANRGEIALRVLRTARALGLEVVVGHSAADSQSLPVRLADSAVDLGEPYCYLEAERQVEAALDTGCGAVHPGYGFLSENPGFARGVVRAGLLFVGPSAATLEALGDKVRARATAAAANVQTIPGTPEPLSGPEQALEMAAQMNYPVLLKARHGGGGRGLRLCQGPEELDASFHLAAKEAEGAFGSAELYLEKYLKPARHLEVQFLSDEKGRGVWLGERECSVQRRHQKLLEEAPSPALDEAQRVQIGKLALKVAAQAGYVGAGTVEFLYTGPGQFYFMEVNARLQVEHPVTEMVTGLDLVAHQLSLAAGEPLGLAQDQLRLRGHAVELRVNCEDPWADFAPRPGRVEVLRLPQGPGLRVDTHLYPGYTVPPHYDSLVAKLIAWGPDRTLALARLRVATAEFRLGGFPTTLPLHQALLDHSPFTSGAYDTTLLEGFTLPQPQPPQLHPRRRAALAVAAALGLGLEGAPSDSLKSPSTTTGPHLPSPVSAWAQAGRLEALRGRGGGWE